MKKLILLFACLWLGSGLYAQTLSYSDPGTNKIATITGCTANWLNGNLNASALSTITSLTITGTIDARDIRVMRDLMTALTDINLSGVTIAAISSVTNGTNYGVSTSYYLNTLPQQAFSKSSAPTGTGARLKTFVCPNNLTTISGSAFNTCNAMTSISLPSTLNSISDGAFNGCSALFTVNAASTYYSTDAAGALYNKNKTSLLCFPANITGSFTIPSTVTSTGAYAFGYTSLSSVTIPSSVTALGIYTFYQALSLATISLPTTLTTIGANAFQYSAVSTITIPSSVTSIGNSAFNYGNFKIAHIQNSNPANISLGTTVFGSSTTTIYVPNNTAVAAFQANGSWSAYSSKFLREIPTTLAVTAGGLSALLTASEKPLCTTLTLTGTVDARDFKSLRDEFTSLATIDLSGVSIAAYSGSAGPAPGSASVNYPRVELPQYAFNGKSVLTSISLPTNLSSIGQYALHGVNITTLTLPAGVSSLDRDVFSNSSSLTSVVLSASLLALQTNAFANCTKLSSVNTSTCKYLTAINYAVFYNCTSLQSITLPNTVTYIGPSVFYGCTSLTSFTSPTAMYGLYSSAFAGCTALSSFTMSPAVTLIQDNCFQGCTALTTINIPTTVTDFGSGVFSGCTALTDITSGTGWYQSRSGVLVFGKEIVAFPAGRTGTYSIPADITSIGKGAFSGCKNITAIDFGATPTLTTIKSLAFENCTGLTSVTIPSSVASLDGNSFAGCSNIVLTYAAGSIYKIIDGITFSTDGKILISYPNTKSGTYIIPDGVTSIADNAFKNCTNLTSVILPKSVTTLGINCFYGCSALSSVVLSSALTSIADYTFYGCTSLDNVTIPSSVTRIGSNAFAYCSGLKTLNLSEGLTEIGVSAFYGIGISSVDLPSTVTTIKSGAYRNSTKILSITLPANLSVLETEAFSLLSNVTKIVLKAVKPTDLSATLDVFASINLAACKLYVPAGSATAYSSAPVWKGFTNIIEGTPASSVVEVDINTSSAGTLQTTLATAGTDLTTITKLTVHGPVNAIDFKLMRDNMPVLATIDLSNATVAAISSATTLGTNRDVNGNPVSTLYLANVIPKYALYNKKSTAAVVLPLGLDSIDGNAFQQNDNLQTINIPEGIKTIGSYAFHANYALHQLVLPSTLTAIRSGAFRLTTAITKLVIPAGVNRIGSYAFSYMSGLRSLTVMNPAPVNFNATGNVSTLVFDATTNGSNAASLMLYVPMATASAYTASAQWSSFATIEQANTITKAVSAAGNLTNDLTAGEKASVTKLILTGSINAKDFKALRDEMPLLKRIDLSGISSIAALPASTEGTGGTASISYFANVIPMMAFNGKMLADSISLPATGIDSIGNSVFKGCSALKYIGNNNNIPTTVQALATDAFNGCVSLTSLILPSALQTLGSSVFGSCIGLTTITLTNVSTVGSNLFTGCSGLTSVTLPGSLTAIKSNMFKGCSALSSITMPGVTSIANNAFEGCVKLASVDLSNVTSIGSYAFSGCSALKPSVTLPALTAINSSAFAGCSGLTALTIPTSVLTISDYAFQNCTGLTVVTIPKQVTSLASSAFSGCTGLNLTIEEGGSFYKDPTNSVIYTSSAKTSLVSCPSTLAGSFTVPASVTSIAKKAFAGCNQLTDVVLPAGLVAVPDSAFLNCVGLLTVKLNSDLQTIGVSAFQGCVKMTTCAIPATVSSIGASAFENCLKLADITLSNATTFTRINPRTFYGCSAVAAQVVIPASVTSIGKEAFYGVGSLPVTLPDGITTIEQEAFSGAGFALTVTRTTPADLSSSPNAFLKGPISSLMVPAGTASAYAAAIGWNVFNAYTSPLTKTLSGLTPGAIAGGTLLTVDELGLTTKLVLSGAIDARDFKYINNNMLGLTDLDLNGVTIEAYTGTEGTATPANYDYKANFIPPYGISTRLQSITLPAVVDTIGFGAFTWCNKLTSITLPSSVKYIDNSAFEVCTRLTSINIPASVSFIGAGAFSGCANLSSISLPFGVTQIGNETFRGCINLKTINIPSSVTSIGDKAFMTCEKLKSVHINSDINHIGAYAFANCIALDTIYTSSYKPTTLGLATSGATPYVFYGSKASCIVKVPSTAAIATYQTYDQWKDFGSRIVADPTIAANNKQLAVKVYLEGLWNGSGLNKCKKWDNGLGDVVDAFTGSVSDTLSVELHSSTYANIAYKLKGLELNTDGTINTTSLGWIDIPSDFAGSYYITIKHRNHLETTTAAMVPFSTNSTTYDFTTGSGQAYVYPDATFTSQKLKDGKWMIYVGDVLKDVDYPQITAFDMMNIFYNYSDNTGVYGYLLGDINGDGFVDAFDFMMCFYNYNDGIYFYKE